MNCRPRVVPESPTALHHVGVECAAARRSTTQAGTLPLPSGDARIRSREEALPTLAMTDLAKKYGRNSTAGLLPSLLLSGASPEAQDEAAVAEMFQAERESLLQAMRETVRAGGSLDGIVNRTEQLFRDTLAKYHAKTPQLRDMLKKGPSAAADAAAKKHSGGVSESSRGESHDRDAADSSSSFLELATDMRAAGMGMEGGCEVCVYVLENKQMRQPFLCRGLKAAQYQQVCVSVLVSLTWWLENEVY